MSEGNGANFNAQVEATAFAGSARSDIEALKADVRDIKTAVAGLRADVTAWRAVLGFAGFVLPIAVTVAMKILWP